MAKLSFKFEPPFDFSKLDKPWSYVVGDGKQLNWPNTQSCLECSHARGASKFSVHYKHNGLTPIGPILLFASVY